jgi:septum formation protein
MVLAERKATAVAGRWPSSLVLGCDSLLDFEGRALGKPATAAEAGANWHRLGGRRATLCTGHCLVDSSDGRVATGLATAEVHFGRPSSAEIEAYVATGEPLACAGGFTIDGFGAPFVDAIAGDAGCVLGLSMPLFRRLLADLGLGIVDLWRRDPRTPPSGTPA